MRSKKNIIKRAKSDLKSLKSLYKNACNDTENKSLSWVYDNFEALKSETKNAVSSLKSDKYLNGDLDEILLITDSLVRKNKFTENNITELFDSENLSEAKVRNLRNFCVLSLLHFCTLAAENMNEDEISKVFEMFLGINDVDFDCITRNLSIIYRTLSAKLEMFYALDEKSKAICVKGLESRANKDKISEKEAAEKAVSLALGNESEFYNYCEINKTHPCFGTLFLILQYLLPLASAIASSIYFGSLWLWIVLFLPHFEIVRKWIYRVSSKLIAPREFLRLNENDEKVKNSKTVIAYCTLLPKNGDFSRMESALKELMLTNAYGENNIIITALCDFYEADEKTLSGDEEIIKNAEKMISRLSEKYGNEKFTCFIRKREYSKTQNKFVGFERKRGAVGDLIRFTITGEENGNIVIGDKNALSGAAFVFVADSDTRLSNGAVKNLVSVAVHPLYKANIDYEQNKVKSGFGIFSPAIVTDVESAYKTRFSRVMAGVGGYSLYDAVASEFYSDCFGDAVFQGKGLIDVKAFEFCVSKKIKPERILSHDIIEGGYLKTALVTDVEASDSFPKNCVGFFSRLDRWIRGDVQNAAVISGSAITGAKPNALTRFKLFDNIVRAAVPVGAAVCILLSAFFPQYSAILLLTAFSAYILNPFLFLLRECIFKPKNVFRRFFSRTLPFAVLNLRRALFEASLIPLFSFVSLKAILSALYSMTTKKGLLNWTVSFDSERKNEKLISLKMFLPSLIFGAVLIFFGNVPTACCGAWFIIIYAVFYICGLIKSEPDKEKIIVPFENEKQELLQYAKEHFSYFSEFCTEKYGFLPPDNVILDDKGNIEKINSKTSPTNIGFYLLSVLCAEKLGVIDSQTSDKMLTRSLETIEKMKKYKGNLYNWYDLESGDTVSTYVSSVDSGNFLCSLVALKNGLSESVDLGENRKTIIGKLEKLLNEVDFSAFYNPGRGLLHTGIDGDTNIGTTSFYDLFMSEMRMTSFFAVSNSFAPKEHWQKLMRKEKSKNLYSGFLSWTGTAFEYLMSCIFLPFYEGTDVYESIKYSLYCQKKAAKKQGIPFGISESAYYEFDDKGGYKYIADGVEKTALKKSVGKNFAVSPYSSFLYMCIDRNGAIRNLQRLEKYGARCRYGFYDTVDFTKKRVGAEPRPVKTCMAHHIGMSFLSIYNELSDNGIHEWFMADENNAALCDLLKERM